MPAAAINTAEAPVPAAVEAQANVEQASNVSFDPVALKAKYLEERDIRIARGGGNTQYKFLDGASSKYLKDPWTGNDTQREPVVEETEVVIVGAGYGAQLIATELQKVGVTDFRMIDKAGDFGGTWYWNRYPGAQCDIESYIYMPLLEETGYMPTEKYAHQDELLEHAQRIGKHFGLYERALFETEVKEMRWNEDESKWLTTTSRGDKITSRFVIPAAGPLHKPKLPGIKGLDSFKGHTFHTSRWDFDYTGGDVSGGLVNLQDKRVAIIGTGATSVQIVPRVGEYAKELYVFQRTPSSIDVRNNQSTDETWFKGLEPGWQKKRMQNFNRLINGAERDVDLVNDSWTSVGRILMENPLDWSDPVAAGTRFQMIDFEKMEAVRHRASTIVKHQPTAESLKAYYNRFCKRPCFHDEYLQTFNRPSVHLIDTRGAGVDALTPTSIVSQGKEYPVDAVIFSTGFETSNDWSHKTGITMLGRDTSITEKWKNGLSTLHGSLVRGFPNAFFVQYFQAALTFNLMHVTGEQAQHFAHIIAAAKAQNIRSVEPTQEAEDGWVNTIVQGAAGMAQFFGDCTPGYYNNEGTVSEAGAKMAGYPQGADAFFQLLADWRAEGRLEGLEKKFYGNAP
ncbi:uncharacterized protein N0V89_010231 [Didymosphaeria variabile]|uniref:FAD/NAD(P)-binding domain-containing protein n=1 Tax=Didymosphaeria variabile TaxID=1932322 RepID=A0A9W9C7C0_9PLEO|nr:uncharacterized protein N0V89_010231 [Didymosphaeria variabile]KAJ4348852.1 hypothetical protein N0V89_010231 [Didymosphaeria variabile]